MPNGNTAGAERQYRAMDGAVPNRDTEGANRRDYSKCDDDRLGRTDIARHIADMLYHAPVDHSIVFGLSGTWGSGKTSLLNMVGELLGTYDEPPIIVRFNPWNYPVGTDLVKPFLALLAKEIRHARSENKARNLADAIGD